MGRNDHDHGEGRTGREAASALDVILEFALFATAAAVLVSLVVYAINELPRGWM